jgi:Icc-related predicted phosphoesterase
MIRVAAAGDVHFGVDSVGTLAPQLAELSDRADLLLLAGDLTKAGHPEEAAALARDLGHAQVPIVSVLGNHDYHADRQGEVRAIVEGAGVTVLEGESVILDVAQASIGIAGAKGFGGGFAGASATEFGEPEMKSFVRTTRHVSDCMEQRLDELGSADVRIALLHYAPIRDTLQGEPPEIFAFLGSYLLGEAVDRGRADLVIHGHAHRGREKGVTPGGINVRNVAQAVIGRAYTIYNFG